MWLAHESTNFDWWFGWVTKRQSNDVHVFWSCHREPTDFIKENFDYKVFFNGGEEYGAYEQAINYLDIDDNDVCCENTKIL